MPSHLSSSYKLDMDHLLPLKKSNGKVVANKVGKKDWSWNSSIWVPMEIITNIKGLKGILEAQDRL